MSFRILAGLRWRLPTAGDKLILLAPEVHHENSEIADEPSYSTRARAIEPSDPADRLSLDGRRRDGRSEAGRLDAAELRRFELGHDLRPGSDRRGKDDELQPDMGSGRRRRHALEEDRV